MLIALFTLTALCANPGLRSVPYAVLVQAEDTYAPTWVRPRQVCPQEAPSPKPKKHKK
jgi:hypothetical protein